MNHGLPPFGFDGEDVFFVKNIAVDAAAAGEYLAA